jgi:imidazolonepropionase-like amidohydrolase
MTQTQQSSTDQAPARRHVNPWIASILTAALVSPALPATLLQNVRVIDGSGRPPMEHADLLFDQERIVSIGPRGRVPPAPGTEKIDCTGLSVLPGLISDHSHLGQVDGTRSGSENATRGNVLRQLAQYEAYGVTTVMSLGLNRDIFYELQPAVHAGALPGADMFGADRGFGAVNGGPPREMGIADDQVYRPATPAAARAAVRESLERKPTLLKLWLDDFNGTKPDKMPPEIYAAIIDEAHRNQVRVAAHVFYLEDAKRLVSAGIDILAHGVRDRPVDPELTRLLTERKVWYVPTLGLDESFYLFAAQPELLEQPLLRHALQPALLLQLNDAAWRAKTLSDGHKLAAEKEAGRLNLKNLKTLFDAGVQIGFGTDSGATPLRIAGFAEHRELKLLMEAGLTPLQAIHVATGNAGLLLGLQDRGTLEPGKLADLILVRGNPALNIADLDSVSAVWRRGSRSPHVIGDFQP